MDSGRTRVSRKLILLGTSGVGKTCIVQRLVQGEFSEGTEVTVGAQYSKFVVQRGDYSIEFEIWDTAGQERYRALSQSYYRGAKAVVFVYDITKSESFDCLKQFMNMYEGDEDFIGMVIGNKCDLESERQVSDEGGRRFAADCGYGFMETSAKLDRNIKELFNEIADKMIADPKRYLSVEADENEEIKIVETDKKKKCC